MKNRTAVATALLLAAALTVTLAAPATAADKPTGNTDQGSSIQSTSVTSEACLGDVAAIAARTGASRSEGEALCTGTVTLEESAPVLADLSNPEFANARTVFKGPYAYYRNWTHTYWGGSIVEVHAGQTWWDDDVAWIATYDGLAGNHNCHTEGSWAAGWAVKQLECTKPHAGASADAYYRFDASAFFEGSPVTLGIGLHYSTNASGGSTSWQVGG